MATTSQTVGDVLPDDLKSNYSSTVLNLPLEDAQSIQQGETEWPKGFTQQHADELDDIYEKSLEASGDDTSGGPGTWGS